MGWLRDIDDAYSAMDRAALDCIEHEMECSKCKYFEYCSLGTELDVKFDAAEETFNDMLDDHPTWIRTF